MNKILSSIINELPEKMQDGFIVLDQEGNILFSNKKFCDMLEFTKEELESRNVSDIEVMESAEEVKKHIAEIADGRNTLFDTVHKKKDGSTLNVQVYTNFLVDEGNVYVYSIIRDISGIKNSEINLVKSEQRLLNIINSINDLIIIFSKDGVYQEYYQSSKDNALYVSPEEFVGKHYEDVMPPNVVELTDEAFDKIKNTLGSTVMDYDLKIGEELKSFSAKLSPILTEKEKFNGVVAVIRDVTQRRKLENELKEKMRKMEAMQVVNEKRYKKLIDQEMEIVRLKEKLAKNGE